MFVHAVKISEHCFYRIQLIWTWRRISSVREVCYIYIYVCVVVTFVRIVNSDIVLGRRKQFYLKRLCAYNSDHSREKEEEKKNFFVCLWVCMSLCCDWKLYEIEIQNRKNTIILFKCWIFFFFQLRKWNVKQTVKVYTNTYKLHTNRKKYCMKIWCSTKKRVWIKNGNAKTRRMGQLHFISIWGPGSFCF